MCQLIIDMNCVDQKTIIRNLILSMDSPFTMEDVVNITKQYNVFDNELIKSIILNLCESGLLTHVGDLFYILKDLYTYAQPI